MAEQILHGSNVVTAASKAVANEWRRVCGVAGFVMPACSTAFEGALKGLVIHVMATHDTAFRGSVECVCTKTQNHGQECPARGYFRSRASGSATPLRPSAWSFSHHARAREAARAGWVPSSRQHQGLILSFAPPAR